MMKRTSFRPAIETLERRTVLAAGLSGGVLTVQGGVGADTVVVSQSGNNVLVTLNSVNSLFPLADVSSVRINGAAGGDSITYTLGRNVTISGGDGNNTITARGSNLATIFGGTGDDTITAEAVRAFIRSGSGHDTITATTSGLADISGGVGNDTITSNEASRALLSGNDGNDTIHANNVGFATISGGAGDDSIECTASEAVVIHGDSGDDAITCNTPGLATLDGGSENDTIISNGTGHTIILGGSGNDQLTGGFGTNNLDGGGGADAINGRGTSNRLRGGRGVDTFSQEGGPSRLQVDHLDVFTLRAGLDTANYEPVLTLSGTIGYVRGQPAVVLASNAVLSDADSANFAGGTLRVQITTGDEAANRLLIGPGFSLDGTNVVQGSTVIGTLNGNGVGTNDLVVTFNADATKSTVQSLIRSIKFRTSGSAGTRNVVFSVTDGDGGASEQQTKQVNVT